MIDQDVTYSKGHRFLHGLLRRDVSAPLQADAEEPQVQGVLEHRSVQGILGNLVRLCLKMRNRKRVGDLDQRCGKLAWPA